VVILRIQRNRLSNLFLLYNTPVTPDKSPVDEQSDVIGASSVDGEGQPAVYGEARAHAAESVQDLAESANDNQQAPNDNQQPQATAKASIETAVANKTDSDHHSQKDSSLPTPKSPSKSPAKSATTKSPLKSPHRSSKPLPNKKRKTDPTRDNIHVPIGSVPVFSQTYECEKINWADATSGEDEDDSEEFMSQVAEEKSPVDQIPEGKSPGDGNPGSDPSGEDGNEPKADSPVDPDGNDAHGNADGNGAGRNRKGSPVEGKVSPVGSAAVKTSAGEAVAAKQAASGERHPEAAKNDDEITDSTAGDANVVNATANVADNNKVAAADPTRDSSSNQPPPLPQRLSAESQKSVDSFSQSISQTFGPGGLGAGGLGAGGTAFDKGFVNPRGNDPNANPNSGATDPNNGSFLGGGPGGSHFLAECNAATPGGYSSMNHDAATPGAMNAATPGGFSTLNSLSRNPLFNFGGNSSIKSSRGVHLYTIVQSIMDRRARLHRRLNRNQKEVVHQQNQHTPGMITATTPGGMAGGTTGGNHNVNVGQNNTILPTVRVIGEDSVVNDSVAADANADGVVNTVQLSVAHGGVSNDNINSDNNGLNKASFTNQSLNHHVAFAPQGLLNSDENLNNSATNSASGTPNPVNTTLNTTPGVTPGVTPTVTLTPGTASLTAGVTLPGSMPGSSSSLLNWPPGTVIRSQRTNNAFGNTNINNSLTNINSLNNNITHSLDNAGGLDSIREDALRKSVEKKQQRAARLRKNQIDKRLSQTRLLDQKIHEVQKRKELKEKRLEEELVKKMFNARHNYENTLTKVFSKLQGDRERQRRAADRVEKMREERREEVKRRDRVRTTKVEDLEKRRGSGTGHGIGHGGVGTTGTPSATPGTMLKVSGSVGSLGTMLTMDKNSSSNNLSKHNEGEEGGNEDGNDDGNEGDETNTNLNNSHDAGINDAGINDDGATNEVGLSTIADESKLQDHDHGEEDEDHDHDHEIETAYEKKLRRIAEKQKQKQLAAEARLEEKALRAEKRLEEKARREQARLQASAKQRKKAQEKIRLQELAVKAAALEAVRKGERFHTKRAKKESTLRDRTSLRPSTPEPLINRTSLRPR
jgi:hypothetical protein